MGSACRACGKDGEDYMQYSDLKFPTEVSVRDLGPDARKTRKWALRDVNRFHIGLNLVAQDWANGSHS